MIYTIFKKIFNFCFSQPLQELFRSKYEGISNVEICAKMTNTRESTWQTAPEDCEVLIQNAFQTFRCQIEIPLYILMCFCSGKYVIDNIICKRSPQQLRLKVTPD